jgi:toxin ParE1/3/4
MRLRGTESAASDLIGISRYLTKREGAVVTRRIVFRISDSLQTLTEFPRKGRTGRVSGTRELIVPGLPWLVIYRIHDDSVVISRVLHGARRFP